MENNIASILFARGIMPDDFISYSTYGAVSEIVKEMERLREERKNQADKYNDLRNLIQRFHQTLIARNYNNIGKWHNERQEYNYELISEVEAILTSKSWLED